MSHARAAIAGTLAGVVVVLAANGADSVTEASTPVAFLLLSVIALLLLPDFTAWVLRRRGITSPEDDEP